jgi:acetyl-CoA acetyltransferase
VESLHGIAELRAFASLWRAVAMLRGCCSGGLESKGHPLGATGVAQAVELCRQLRGEAGGTQVGGAPAVALQHNYGWASAACVTIYRRHANLNAAAQRSAM